MNPQDQTSLLGVLRNLYKWRKPILLLVALSAVGSIVVSLLLPNYYTATATVTPINEEKNLFENNPSGTQSLYGDEEAIDRVLLFAQSNALADFVIDSFDLETRYSIDASTPKGEAKLRKRFFKLYHVQKNELNGIELSIEDTEPAVAAQLLSVIIERIQSLYKQAPTANKRELLVTYEQSITQLENELSTFNDSLISLRQTYKIYDVDQQAEDLSGALVSTESRSVELDAKIAAYQKISGSGVRDSLRIWRARREGLGKRLELLQERLDAFNNGQGRITTLENTIRTTNRSLAAFRENYNQFKADLESQASSLIVLEPVQLPRLKSYPIRWLIVVVSTLFGLIFAVIGALFAEAYKQIDWPSILQEDSNSKHTEK